MGEKSFNNMDTLWKIFNLISLWQLTKFNIGTLIWESTGKVDLLHGTYGISNPIMEFPMGT